MFVPLQFIRTFAIFSILKYKRVVNLTKIEMHTILPLENITQNCDHMGVLHPFHTSPAHNRM